MNRLAILPLVLALSGAPFAALVCDLLLCRGAAAPARQASSSPATTPAEGCHEHAAPASGARVADGSRDCSHLAAPDPYVASPRVGPDARGAAAVASAAMSAPAARRSIVVRGTGDAPSVARRTPPVPPLRI